MGVVRHEAGDLSDRFVATDERGQLARQVMRGNSLFCGSNARATGGEFERRARLRRQAERIGDTLERFAIRRLAIASLQRAHSLHADCSAIRERLLRKAGTRAEAL